MKKLFSFVAVAAAISFAACTGNKAESAAQDEACCEGEKTEECGKCPVKAVTESLNAALESGDAQAIGQAVKDAVAAAGELAKAGKTEAVDALVKNVQQFITTNEQKLQELGAIDAVKSIPTTVEELVKNTAASAENAATTVKESAEAAANQGLIALCNGDLSTAETLIAKATGANGLSEVLGNLNLAKGNYAQAEQDFKDVYSNSAALAQILNKNYASAAVTLKYVKNPDATTDYLKSILAARMGNVSDAAQSLRDAISKDASYAKYAANDLELKKVAK